MFHIVVNYQLGSLLFLSDKYDKQLENGECQMNSRQSDSLIVP